jgi:hypothetical protein
MDDVSGISNRAVRSTQTLRIIFPTSEVTMSGRSSNIRRAVFGVAGLFLTLLSAFFVFYTARLLYVTQGLRAIRPGGQGAYVGAVVFPLLALLLGLAAWRCFKALRRR